MVDASTQTVKLRTRDLMPHEDVSQHHLKRLARRMEEEGIQRRPIVVFRVGNKFLIIDGHHRAAALENLGYASVLATEIGFYLTNFVSVESWRTNGFYDKTTIIQRALGGEVYPPRTTKHVVRFNGGPWERFHHHKDLAPEVNISLKELKRENKTPPPPMRLI